MAMNSNEELIAKFKQWNTVEKNLSPLTIEAYRTDVEQFAQFLNNRPLVQTLRSDVGAFSGKLLGNNIEPSSVARKLATLRQFFRLLILDRIITKDPTANVPAPKGWKKMPRFLSLKEVEQFLDENQPGSEYGPVEFPGYSGQWGTPRHLLRRDQAMLELLYAGALRASEVATARVADLNLEARILMVCGKGSKTRIVPLGRPAANSLEQYLKFLRWRLLEKGASPWLFVGAGGEALTRQRVWQIVKRRARALNLNMTTHTLRHSCATHMVENGADIRTVQTILGHALIETTEIYTHVSPAWVWKNYREHHPRAHSDSSHSQMRLLEVDTLRPKKQLTPGPIICAQCMTPVCSESKWYCAEHLRLNRETGKRLHARRVAAGLCISCPTARCEGSKIYCAEHLRRAREANRAAKIKKASRRSGEGSSNKIKTKGAMKITFAPNERPILSAFQSG
jgi:integrase/recombinase XerD